MVKKKRKEKKKITEHRRVIPLSKPSVSPTNYSILLHIHQMTTMIMWKNNISFSQKLIIASIVLIFCTSTVSSSAIFSLKFRYAGTNRSLNSLKLHDTNRLQMLSNLDLPLGGTGRPDSSGSVLYPFYFISLSFCLRFWLQFLNFFFLLGTLLILWFLIDFFGRYLLILWFLIDYFFGGYLLILCFLIDYFFWWVLVKFCAFWLLFFWWVLVNFVLFDWFWFFFYLISSFSIKFLFDFTFLAVLLPMKLWFLFKFRLLGVLGEMGLL